MEHLTITRSDIGVSATNDGVEEREEVGPGFSGVGSSRTRIVWVFASGGPVRGFLERD